MKNILIVGATSAIATAYARLNTNRESTFYLLARNTEQLTLLQKDLEVRGANAVYTDTFDASKPETLAHIVDKAFDTIPTIDTVLVAHGSLPNQTQCESDTDTLIRELNINATSTVVILTQIAARMETRQTGTVAVITSVAGDRGRQSNYVYGASKKMVSTYLQGLRNRLYKSNVHVVDIKPGFVDTPMTQEFDKNFLWASSNKVAKDIDKAINRQYQTLYTPFFWRYIMLIIKNIPESIFKKMSL